MVMYFPASLNSIGQTFFELESGSRNVDGQTNKQTNEWTELHQFRKEPSYDGELVIYLPVKFEFDWTQCFRVRVQKQKCWQTNEQKTNKQTDKITPISKGTELWWWSISLSSLNSIGQTVFQRTDGQTDIKHINLIGGLVIHKLTQPA